MVSIQHKYVLGTTNMFSIQHLDISVHKYGFNTTKICFRYTKNMVSIQQQYVLGIQTIWFQYNKNMF